MQAVPHAKGKLNAASGLKGQYYEPQSGSRAKNSKSLGAKPKENFDILAPEATLISLIKLFIPYIKYFDNTFSLYISQIIPCNIFSLHNTELLLSTPLMSFVFTCIS